MKKFKSKFVQYQNRTLLWKRNLQNSDWLSSVVQEKVERQGNRSGTGREKPEEQESVSSHSETPGGFEESQEKLSGWEW